MFCQCRYGYKSAVGFVPTGWTFQTKAESFPVHEKPPWKIHLIPYSEHSSFSDLQEFVGFLRPKHIIPTVGVSGDDGERNTHKMLTHFRHLCDQSGAKRAFLGPLIAASGSSEACHSGAAACGAHTGLGKPNASTRSENSEDPAREQEQAACVLRGASKRASSVLATAAPGGANSCSVNKKERGAAMNSIQWHKENPCATGEASNVCEVPPSPRFVPALCTLFLLIFRIVLCEALRRSLGAGRSL